MHRPIVATAFLVAPLVGFNLASVITFCADDPAASSAPVVHSASAAPPAVDEAYREGRAWGAELVTGAAPADGDACADAAGRWWAYEMSVLGPGAGAVGAPDAAARIRYQQGCSDAVVAATG